MAPSRRRDLVIVAVAALALAACGGSSTTAPTSQSATTSLAAGETIFQRGVFDGQPIPRTGSSGGGMMDGGGMSGGGAGGGMMRAGCATCHGADGHGRSTPTFTSPHITYSNLTDPQGMLQPDGTRGPTYTDTTLRTAVTQGLDPEGSRLESPMPQWQLTGPEWADLLAYLNTLK
jgi:cytochrome c oxidase subunit II